MRPDRSGRLKRGSLCAVLLAAASAQPQSKRDLRLSAQTALGTPVNTRRLHCSLYRLRAQGHLTEDHTRTPKGDTELARLCAPLNRNCRNERHSPHTGSTERIRRLLKAFTQLHTGHLAAALGIERHRINTYLCELARRGQVERVPGTYFQEYRLIRGAA